MPSKHEPFWRMLESRYERIAIPVEWKTRLGTEFANLLSFLTTIDRWAKFYPNPHDPRGAPFDVFSLPNGSFDAVSNNKAHLLELKAEDVYYQRWNMQKFCKVLVDSLSIDPSTEPVTPRDKVIRLGNFRIPNAGEFPVIWVLASLQEDFVREVSGGGRFLGQAIR